MYCSGAFAWFSKKKKLVAYLYLDYLQFEDSLHKDIAGYHVVWRMAKHG